MYVSAELQSSRWTPTITAGGDLEIDWVRIGDRAFVAALYHPTSNISSGGAAGLRKGVLGGNLA